MLTPSTTDILAIAPEIILTVAAGLVLVIEAFLPRLRRSLSAFSMFAIAVALWARFSLELPGTVWAGMLRIDQLTAFVDTYILIAAFLAFRFRKSPYRSLIHATLLASSWKVGTVMHEHFPKEFFKYVAIAAAIGIVLAAMLVLAAGWPRGQRETTQQIFRIGVGHDSSSQAIRRTDSAALPCSIIQSLRPIASQPRSVGK